MFSRDEIREHFQEETERALFQPPGCRWVSNSTTGHSTWTDNLYARDVLRAGASITAVRIEQPLPPMQPGGYVYKVHRDTQESSETIQRHEKSKETSGNDGAQKTSWSRGNRSRSPGS